MRQLTELKKNPNDSFSVGLGDDGNLFRWEIMIMGPADSLFEGGFFKAEMTFPPDFPNSPPTLKFLSKMWHPNGIALFSNTISRWYPEAQIPFPDGMSEPQ